MADPRASDLKAELSAAVAMMRELGVTHLATVDSAGLPLTVTLGPAPVSPQAERVKQAETQRARHAKITYGAGIGR